MLEVIVFAVVLVFAQIVGEFIMMGLIMSEPFMKYYTKKIIKTMKDMEKTMFDLKEEEES